MVKRRMEEILNEPSDSGLSKTMGQFQQALSDLATDPKNSGARAVVAERGLSLTGTFNHLSDFLTSIRTDLKSEIDATVNDANSLLRQIDGLNEQIQKVEPHGMLPNDLYDERDRLVDELSGIVNIKVTYDKSSSSSMDIAQGIAKIELVGDKGGSIDDGTILLDGKGSPGINEISISEDSGGNIDGFNIAGKESSIKVGPLESMGSLRGLIESYGYDNDDGLEGQYPEMIASLDKMAVELAKAFNEVHRNEENLGKEGIDFFIIDPESGGAGVITVNQGIFDDPSLINASTDGTSGNGDNASALRDVFNKPIEREEDVEDPLGGKSITGFYESLIGKLGVEAQEANRMAENTGVLQAQVENERMSLSSVSLDEEMANMIQFQHAYNAAARSMTTIDEMIDRIINSMGLVGR